MNRCILLFVLLISFLSVNSQVELFNKIKIKIEDNTLETLSKEGIPLEGEVTRDGFFISDLSQSDIEILTNENIEFTVLIHDVSSYYVSRNEQFQNINIVRDDRDEWTVPEGWEYGTMGGFYTFEQMLAELDTMVMLYPDLVSEIQQLDITSIEDRPIYWVKISDNPGVNEDEPEVLYTGLHHAREPISMQQLIFYMYYLLENYETDEDIQYLVNTTEMYFVPCLNPDGYVYNQSTSPNGGGMWRKNRKNSGSGNWGVDLNRNYSYEWGHDNNGSSPDPWEETYRGTEPFSEPETQAVREFCMDNDFKMALNYHSYSNLLLYTWGWTPDPCPDDEILEAYAKMMTEENNYTYGPGSTTIYPTNGGSDDWMYGDTVDKPRFYSYTPEVGNGNDGFWPSISRIIPLCQENMHQNIMAAKLVGKYATVNDEMPFVIGDYEGHLKFSIQRLGLQDEDFTVSIIPQDGFAGVGDSIIFSDMELMETIMDSISFVLEPEIQVGDSFSYIISVNNGDIVENTEVTKLFGETVVVFEEPANNLNNWTGTWQLTDEDYISPSYSITDSPYDEYSNNSNKSLILSQYIDLENTIYAELTFRAKWEIEDGYDYVQVLVSDGGNNWEPLEGLYTDPGTQYQTPGLPVYDGFSNGWIKETINLGDYLGESIRLRFKLRSDVYVTEDGFYFDDLKVSVIDDITGIEEPDLSLQNLINGPFPNPANDIVRFEVRSGTDFSGPLSIEYYDLTGKMIYQTGLPVSGEVFINVADWNKGVYFYEIKLKNHRTYTGKQVIF